MHASSHIKSEASSQQITQSSGSNFTHSFFFLPKEKREAMTCIYAFCRLSDNVIDEAASQNEAKEKQNVSQKSRGERTDPPPKAKNAVNSSVYVFFSVDPSRREMKATFLASPNTNALPSSMIQLDTAKTEDISRARVS